jgi:hypothetical protein
MIKMAEAIEKLPAAFVKETLIINGLRDAFLAGK